MRLLQTNRLVTLIGPGGCGKTRLAMETGAGLAQTFSDGVYWVDLSTLTDPALVAQTVLRALGLGDLPGHTPLATLVAQLRPCRLVLILDNCEHLVAACAHLAYALLTSCPDLYILTTSREGLGMLEEAVYPVPSLSTPEAEVSDPHRLLEYEGVALFVARAKAVQPSFELTEHNAAAVVHICRQLDGIPLAIELAAARLRTLTVNQIASRLDDRFSLLAEGNRAASPRHQTLTNLMDWSYQLLTSEEQTCLRRLAVFCGGWTRAAAETVIAGDGLPPKAVFDPLTHLVGKSLVVQSEAVGHAWYRFPETIRQYAAGKLEESGECEATRRRHAQTYLAVVQQAEPSLQGGDQSVWLDRLDREHDNLRAALEWTLDRGEGGMALELGAGLWRFWEARGYITEGRHWLDRLLAATEGDASIFRARVLDGAGVFAHYQGDYAAAGRLYQASLALKTVLGDEVGVMRVLSNMGTLAKDRGEPERAELLYTQSLSRAQSLDQTALAAQALLNLGVLFLAQGEYRRAIALLEESVPLFRRAADHRGLANALSNLGLASRNTGDYSRSLTLHQEALSLRQSLADKVGIAFSLANLGLLAQDQADFAQAVFLQEEALAWFRDLGHRWGVALLHASLSLGALYQDQVERAKSLADESLAHFRDLDHHWGIAMALNTLALIAQHRGDDGAEALARESLVLRRDIHDQHGVAECLEALAVTAGSNRPDVALRLDGAATAIRERISAPRAPAEQAYFGPRLARARQALDEQAANDAWRLGHALSLAEAIDYALALDAPAPVAPAPVAPAEVALAPNPPSVVSHNGAQPQVRICALGQSRVYRGDHLLTPSDWTYAKPKELLFFLLSRRVRTKEQIGVMLWPDANVAQLRNRFYPAVHHLRDALGGTDWVLTQREGYAFNRVLSYTYDVEEFETHVAEARRLRERDPQAAIQRLEAALALYQGDFLEDMTADSEWIAIRREELGLLYEEAVLLLADLLFASARYSEATEAYRRAIAHDNLLEVAHRGLMCCYTRQGQRGQAIRHYQSLVALLAKELKAEPAPETKDLYERIARGEEV